MWCLFVKNELVGWYMGGVFPSSRTIRGRQGKEVPRIGLLLLFTVLTRYQVYVPTHAFFFFYFSNRVLRSKQQS